MKSPHVYVPVQAYREHRGSWQEADPGSVPYEEDVDREQWTTDPDRNRNDYDTPGAPTVRVSREWAEETNALVPADEYEPDDEE